MRSSESAPPRSMSRGLRIVGGVHRGRRLTAPAGEAVRPTSDRAREALFNILSHGRFAAAGLPFADRPVLDAFAGTGALGLEAVSRGAGAAAFIESDRAALAALRRNIAALDAGDRAEIIPGDATRPPRAMFACAVAFLDPPYRSGLAAPALAALAAAGWLAADGLAIGEVAAREALPAPPAFPVLHWRGSVPLAETLAGFARLQRDGKIRHHGVSNFNIDDMKEWVGLGGGGGVAANQILYNLGRRGPEWELIPWCRERRIAIMAYTPLGQGRMLQHKALGEIAARHKATPAQVALAWLLRQDGMMVIPKASRKEHVRDNRGALDLRLPHDDIAALDRAFPPPKGPSALGML